MSEIIFWLWFVGFAFFWLWSGLFVMRQRGEFGVAIIFMLFMLIPSILWPLFILWLTLRVKRLR